MPAVNVTAGDIVSVYARSFINGQEDILTTHWRVREASDALEMSAFFTALEAALAPAGELPDTYANSLSNEVHGIRWYGQVIYPVRYIKRALDAIVEGEGAVDSPMLPQNVSAAITLRAVDAVPRARSSKHIGGVPTSFVTTGRITVAGFTAYALLGAKLIQPLSLASGAQSQILDPIIYHRASPDLSLIPIQYAVEETSRIMRRRTVGLGS